MGVTFLGETNRMSSILMAWKRCVRHAQVCAGMVVFKLFDDDDGSWRRNGLIQIGWKNWCLGWANCLGTCNYCKEWDGREHIIEHQV